MVSTNEMKRRLNRYWRERYEFSEDRRDKSRDAVSNHLSRIYTRTQNSIEQEIDSFYVRYANRSGISKQEAKKMADNFDVQAFSDKAAQYVSERNFTPRANEELALYNLEMKVSRLELLQYHLDLDMVALGNDEVRLNERNKEQAYADELRDQSGILGLATPSQQRIRELIQTAVNQSYHGAHFSERIWERVDDLRMWLADNISDAVLKGRNPRELIPYLRDQFDVTRFEAERLAITEMGYTATEAQHQSYINGEFEYYDMVTENSPCDVCVDIASSGPYRTDRMTPGVNAPMVHPFCKCGTAPSVEVERAKLEDMFQHLGV